MSSNAILSHDVEAAGELGVKSMLDVDIMFNIARQLRENRGNVTISALAAARFMELAALERIEWEKKNLVIED